MRFDRRWIPEMARKEPARAISARYDVPGARPPTEPVARVAEALRAAGLDFVLEYGSTWSVTLSGQTRVFGLVARGVDESVQLRLVRGVGGSALELSCRPLETHAAHAAGLAGVLVMAFAVWVSCGLAAGVLPAVTTVLAGGLVVEVTRQWAMSALERRLRLLAGDVGSSLWPGRPAQIISEPADLTAA
jgi:hypothetical protein